METLLRRGRLRTILGTLILLLCIGRCGRAEEFGPRGRALSVSDSIAARRIIRLWSDPEDAVKISPDGRRYLVILIRGDLTRDGNWVEFLTGNLATLDAAAGIGLAAELFTRSGERNPLRETNVTWLGNDRVAFLFNDGAHPTRVVALNLRTHRIEELAKRSTPIQSYAVSPDGKTIVYATSADVSPCPSAQMLARGFAVPDRLLLYDLLRGNLSGDKDWYPEVFVRNRRGIARKIVGWPRRGIFEAPYYQIQLYLSPDGRFALASGAPSVVPVSWAAYGDAGLAREVVTARKSSDEPTSLKQFWVIDLGSATARPLWDAPMNRSSRPVWSPDSRSVLIGPTFLPTRESSPSGLAGQAFAVVNVGTGEFQEIAFPEGVIRGRHFVPKSWNGADEIKLIGGLRSNDSSLTLKRVGGEWESIREPRHFGTVRVELREDTNFPPTLVAVSAVTGAERLVLEINPGLGKEFSLGRVQVVHWVAKDNRPWSGRLYYPVNHSPERRSAFVIQGAAIGPRPEFSLTGTEGTPTGQAAQPLAGRSIAVLIVDGPDGERGAPHATPAELDSVVAGYEGAIEHFVSEGLADPQRIGVTGFSRFGLYTAYFLTHTSYPIAAANVADNADESYLQYLFWGASTKSEYERDVGAAPLGEGLRIWAERAPGFNADKIHAPLRMERDSQGLISALYSWELFSQLRYLRRPVELYLVPDIEHGAHALERPSQLLASQGAIVDWFDFWLNEHEDPNPAKTGQYERWRKLRSLRDSAPEGRTPKIGEIASLPQN